MDSNAPWQTLSEGMINNFSSNILGAYLQGAFDKPPKVPWNAGMAGSAV